MRAEPSSGTPSVETGWRAAERAFWETYGLEPSELHLEASWGRVRVQEVGEGPPVLFVHGTGGPGAYFAPLLAHLHALRCVVIDRPGWGGSDPVQYPSGEFGQFAVGMLIEILRWLSLERAHIVGASVGNVWASRLAQARPDLVKTLTLLGGGPLVDEIEVPRFIRLLRSPLGHLMARAKFTARMETSQATGLGHGPSLEDGRMPPQFVSWKVELTNETRWRVNEREMVRSFLGPGGWKRGLTFQPKELGDIEVPVLMLYGTEDPVGSESTWRSFVEAIPDAKIAVHPNAGHLLWFDQPQEVAARMTEHMVRLRT